jgi:hypothetical protein
MLSGALSFHQAKGEMLAEAKATKGYFSGADFAAGARVELDGHCAAPVPVLVAVAFIFVSPWSSIVPRLGYHRKGIGSPNRRVLDIGSRLTACSSASNEVLSRVPDVLEGMRNMDSISGSGACRMTEERLGQAR